jgi:hypothetical protein
MKLKLSIVMINWNCVKSDDLRQVLLISVDHFFRLELYSFQVKTR